ncbi:MAG: hypothetical protein U0V70_15230 [Terriglobia bacterium]
MKITSQDLMAMGIVDQIIPEPEGGAHNDHQVAAALLDEKLQQSLAELKALPTARLPSERYQRFRTLGSFLESEKLPDRTAPSCTGCYSLQYADNFIPKI